MASACTEVQGFLTEVMALAEMGYCVQPLQAGTKRPHKGWRQAKARTMTEDELETCFGDANVAILTGPHSGGLAVIDFDDTLGLEHYMRWIEKYPLFADRLPTVETRRGKHVYCRLSFDPGGTKVQAAPGVELICGQLATAPPSRVFNTAGEPHVYRWLVPPCPVSDLPRLSRAQLLLSYAPSDSPSDRSCDSSSDPSSNSVTVAGDLSVLRGLLESKESMVSMGHGTWTSEQVAEGCNAAVQDYRCTSRGTRDANQWQFARALKAIARRRGSDFTNDELADLGNQWHEASRDYMEDPDDVYGSVTEIQRRYSLVIIGQGEDMGMLARRILSKVKPGVYPVLEQFRTPGMSRLADLLRVMQRIRGAGKTFYRPQRLLALDLGLCFDDDAQRLESCGRMVSRWLEALQGVGLIEIVDRGQCRAAGTRARAKQFRWLGEPLVISNEVED